MHKGPTASNIAAKYRPFAVVTSQGMKASAITPRRTAGGLSVAHATRRRNSHNTAKAAKQHQHKDEPEIRCHDFNVHTGIGRRYRDGAQERFAEGVGKKSQHYGCQTIRLRSGANQWS